MAAQNGQNIKRGFLVIPVARTGRPEPGTPECASFLAQCMMAIIREVSTDPESGERLIFGDDVLAALIDHTAVVMARHPNCRFVKGRVELCDDFTKKLRRRLSDIVQVQAAGSGAIPLGRQGPG
jgi:hypothetical protein